MTVPPISFTLDAKSGGPGADAGSDLFSKTATPTLAVTIASPSSLNGFAGFNITVAGTTKFVSLKQVTATQTSNGTVYTFQLPSSEKLNALDAEQVTVAAASKSTLDLTPAVSATNTITYDGIIKFIYSKPILFNN